jgi:uncharacterized protein involved in exopolysaccharide biosynthesis
MKNRISITRKDEAAEAGVREKSFEIVDLKLVELLLILLQRKKLIFITVFSVMVITAGITLLLHNTFRSTASILPSGNVDKLAELKSIAGLGGSLSKDENSSTLYPVILRSRSVLDAVLEKSFTFEDANGSQTLTLPEYFGTGERDKLYAGLRGITTIEVDKRTGVINLGVETQYPALSQAVLAAYLAELENFNLYKKRSRAKDNVKYLNRQLELKESELDKARNNLAEFQQKNRNWSGSTDPGIIKDLSRLKLDVEVKSQNYVYVSQELEMSRREVQKDIPVVSILDAPSLPTQKASPRRRATVMIMGILTFLVSSFLVLTLELLRKRSEGPDAEIFQALREDLIRDVPVVNRLLERIKNRSESAEKTETFYV